MEEEEKEKKLRIVVFPWLAMGHLIPYLRLSNLLAKKGHQIYFVSTPKNLSNISPRNSDTSTINITFVSFPLPRVPNLPPTAECSADVTYNRQQTLKKAFDLLQFQLTQFLQSLMPDWVIYDYASHWLQPVAAELGVSCAFFSLFTAAALSFIGPPSVTIDGEDSRSKPEDFTVLPKWIPFESDLVFRLHEVSKYVERSEEDEYGPSDTVRFRLAIGRSDFVIIRSSQELEPEWFDLLSELYRKPIVPIGFLGPAAEVEDGDENNNRSSDKWDDIKGWLDKQEAKSVTYVALGTETALTREEVRELAAGLEKSMLPFFWVLRDFPGSTQTAMEMLPDGFEGRVKGRGVVYQGWAPQVKILSHDSVGGFLTHCGWNSVIEGLMLGRVLVMFPCMNEQGLNARLLQQKKLGLEIPRNYQDGSFTSDSVAEMVRKAMVDESGQSWRAAAMKMSGLIKEENKHERFVERLINYLQETRISKLMGLKQEIRHRNH